MERPFWVKMYWIFEKYCFLSFSFSSYDKTMSVWWEWTNINVSIKIETYDSLISQKWGVSTFAKIMKLKCIKRHFVKSFSLALRENEGKTVYMENCTRFPIKERSIHAVSKSFTVLLFDVFIMLKEESLTFSLCPFFFRHKYAIKLTFPYNFHLQYRLCLAVKLSLSIFIFPEKNRS